MDVFAKIKKKILEKKIKRLLKQSNKRVLVSEKKIKTIAVLTIDKDDTSNVKQMVYNALQVENVVVFSFKTYQKNEKTSLTKFSEKDINWLGNITKPSLKDTLNKEFDLLICLFDKPHTYLEFATLVSKASFKVGFGGVNSLLFDIEIFENLNNFQQYLNELKKYLFVLKKLS